jgi:bacteriorhodopsin
MNSTTVTLATYVFTSFLCLIFFFWKTIYSHKTEKTIYILIVIECVWSVFINSYFYFSKNFLSQKYGIIYLQSYSDWIITTSLTIVIIALFAMFDTKKNISLIIKLILLVVSMQLTGLFADYSKGLSKYLLYGSGFIPFALILYITFVTLDKISKAQHPNVFTAYKKIRLYNLSLWSLYPIFWILGPYGFSLISHTGVINTFYLLNALTKAGQYIYSAINIKAIKGGNRSID